MPFLFQLLTISVLSTVMTSCPFIWNVFSRYSIHISKMLFTKAQCITFVVWADNWSGMFFFYMGRISQKLHQLKGLFKSIINISICRKSIKKTNHPLPALQCQCHGGPRWPIFTCPANLHLRDRCTNHWPQRHKLYTLASPLRSAIDCSRHMYVQHVMLQES